MPALSGQVVMTLRDGSGNIVIQSTTSFVQATGALRDATVSTSDGIKAGALVVDNATNRSVRVVVRDASGAELRNVSVPANGAARTVAQLATLGITTIQDLNGLSFDLA